MKIKNFAILTGEKTTIKNGVIVYEPVFKEDDSNTSDKKDPISSDIRTNVNFSQGIVKFKFKIENKNVGILIIDPPNWNAGPSYSTDSFVIRDVKRKNVTSFGSLNQYGKNEEVSLRFELFGSNAKLFIDEILICQQQLIVQPHPLTIRITSDGKVSVYDIEVEKVQPKLFVVMQFSEEYNSLYKDVIKPVAEEVGFECIRADEFHTSTPILSDIIRSIKESTAIIAEITPNNPNVFYEIGYAHAIDKPTILICDINRDKLPFDLSSFRTLFYENSISGKSKIESSLRKYLKNIIE